MAKSLGGKGYFTFGDRTFGRESKMFVVGTKDTIATVEPTGIQILHTMTVDLLSVPDLDVNEFSGRCVARFEKALRVWSLLNRETDLYGPIRGLKLFANSYIPDSEKYLVQHLRSYISDEVEAAWYWYDEMREMRKAK